MLALSKKGVSAEWLNHAFTPVLVPFGRGEGPRSNTVEIVQKLERLNKELQELDKQENQLDEHQDIIEKSLKGLIEIQSNAELAYITHNDVQSLPYFQNQTLIAVKAPSRAQLIVPEQEKVFRHSEQQSVVASLPTVTSA